MALSKILSQIETEKLLLILRDRFEQNLDRHPFLKWALIEQKLRQNPKKLWSLHQMERTGGEPDVIAINNMSEFYTFFDCCNESPKERRSLCYDREAFDTRKDNKPINNVIDVADAMGVELLTEQQYRNLQNIFKFDLKTSSWVMTSNTIRQQGGALFCDYRYGQVFTYHNGAQSYYASRGFRACINI